MKAPDFPDKRSARRAFDRAAARYDDNAAIQQEVGRRLLDHLEGINILPRRIVDLGCNGRTSTCSAGVIQARM